MAGLKGLEPSPPYSCFAITIAEMTATADTHQGANCGMDSPSRSPVTAAVLSLRTNVMGFLRNLRTMASETKAMAMHQTTLMRLPQPKNRVCASNPGKAASMTYSITLEVGRAL